MPYQILSTKPLILHASVPCRIFRGSCRGGSCFKELGRLKIQPPALQGDLWDLLAGGASFLMMCLSFVNVSFNIPMCSCLSSWIMAEDWLHADNSAIVGQPRREGLQPPFSALYSICCALLEFFPAFCLLYTFLLASCTLHFFNHCAPLELLHHCTPLELQHHCDPQELLHHCAPLELQHHCAPLELHLGFFLHYLVICEGIPGGEWVSISPPCCPSARVQAVAPSIVVNN